MATKKLMLNRARRKNDGSYPLVMQILHHRNKRVIYSKIHLYPDEFDVVQGIVVRSKHHYRMLKEIRVLNKAISEFVRTVEEAVLQCEKSGHSYTTDEIVQHYRSITGGGSLHDYWKLFITELERQGRIGMAAAHRSTMRSVVHYGGASDCSFSGVTQRFVHAYVSSMLANGLSDNTVGFYIRNFKMIFNAVIREGLVDAPKINPFEGVESNPKKTVKRALSRENLRKLTTMEFEGEMRQELELARDLFLFSFYTRGMAFVDIVFLRCENISEETLFYRRRKTKQLLRISVNDSICLLISKYKNASQYIFPIISSKDPVAQYREYKTALRIINKNLKQIQERLGTDVPLTTYVARHSWATQAKEQGFPVSIISEGLGHASEKITRIYLKEFDQSVLDKANDLIAKL